MRRQGQRVGRRGGVGSWVGEKQGGKGRLDSWRKGKTAGKWNKHKVKVTSQGQSGCVSCKGGGSVIPLEAPRKDCQLSKGLQEEREEEEV